MVVKYFISDAVRILNEFFNIKISFKVPLNMLPRQE